MLTYADDAGMVSLRREANVADSATATTRCVAGRFGVRGENMKEIFFKGIVVALPLLVIGGLVYLVFHGFYSLYEDMKLKRELDQIRREGERRRRERPVEVAPQKKTPSPEDLFT